MEQKQTIYACIDSQNLNLGIKSCWWNLDFARFRVYLKDKFNVLKAFLFIGYVGQNQGLYTNLQKFGYILVFKPTLLLPSGKVKGNVDAELVLQSMIEYNNYDKAIIVTGDGDFFCLIDHLAKKDKLLHLIVPNQYKYSSLLRKHMNKIVFLNNLRHKLEMR